MYDQRTNDEIDQSFRRGDRRVEVLIVGQLYIIDFENMNQYRLNDTQRRRRIKYDLISAPKKGVAGLKLDLQRTTEYNPANVETPVVPSLASSVPSIIANSSPTEQSRSNADGEEPSLATPVVLPVDDTNRTAIRLPADGLGNPSTTNPNTWRTSTNVDERRLTPSSSDDDEGEVPRASRLRPVLIGGEDDTQYSNHSNNIPIDDNDITILTNLSLNTSNN